MNPSDFTEFPFGSVLQNSESETVAVNIMKILKRTGNTWRPVSWEEYKLERLRDKDFSEGEKSYFDKVIGYCKNEDTAILFCDIWKEKHTAFYHKEKA